MVNRRRFPAFARQLDADIHTLIHRGSDRRVTFGDRLVALDRIAGMTLIAAFMILSVWLMSVASGAGLLRISSATADSADAAGYPQLAGDVADHLKWSEVRAVQARLAKLGYDPGKIDGLAGRHTLDALNRYRAAQHLERASRVDRTTVGGLLD
jgi:hypothetical protein